MMSPRSPGAILARNRRDERLVRRAVVVRRLDDRVQLDVLPFREPRLQRARLADGNQDREHVVPAVRVEMASADQILIVAPPAARLVRVVADESGRAVLLDRLVVARARIRVA